MDLTAVDRLDEHMKVRRGVECAYFAKYSEWRARVDEELYDEWSLPRVDVDASGLLAELAAIIEEHTFELLRKFALNIEECDPGTALDQLEKHSDLLLREVRRRKWEPALIQLEVFLEDPVIVLAWRQIEQTVASWLWGKVQPYLWSVGGVTRENLFPDEERPKRSHISVQRSNLVISALKRWHREMPEVKFTRKMIWLAAKHKQRTQFERWERDAPGQSEVDDKSFRQVLLRSADDLIKAQDPKIKRPAKNFRD